MTCSLAMLGQGVFYLMIAIWIDHVQCTKFKKTGGQDGKLQPQLDVNADIIEHEKVVRNEENDSQYQIRAVDLRKTYKETNIQAVCGNTFGVKQGEIFGLLGPNGAGKSTTFGMMCLDIAKTSGVAKVLRKRVEEIDVLKEGSYIGLCP
jgi:ATP-binding cassette, subfamily A (ABC1), member 3